MAEGSIRARIPASEDIIPRKPTTPELIFTWPWLDNGMKISQMFLTVSITISLRSMQQEVISGALSSAYLTRLLLEYFWQTAVEAGVTWLQNCLISYKSLQESNKNKFRK